MARFCENCGKEYNLAIEEVFDNPPHLKCKNCEDIIFLEKMPSTVSTSGTGHPSPSTAEVPASSPIRLLLVDDSKLIRKAIHSHLSSDPLINIVGEAENGRIALEKIPALKPDVITLDINMPVMDGITTLKHIMIKYPTPTLMFSTLTQEGARISFEAIKLGALGFIQKPVKTDQLEHAVQCQNMIKKIRLASQVQMEAIKYVRVQSNSRETEQPLFSRCNGLVAMGAAEGCYSALLKIVPKLLKDLPVAYIASIYAERQHLESFCAYLSENSAVTVKMVSDQDVVESGVCYLASYQDEVTVTPDIEGLKLSVHSMGDTIFADTIDKLMISAAEIMRDKAIGILLSGTGQDGTEGLKAIQKQQGLLMVQNPKTCFAKAMVYSAINQIEIAHIHSDGIMASELNRLLEEY